MAFSSEEVELILQLANDATGGSTFEERLETIADGLSVLVPSTSFSAFVLNAADPEDCRHAIFRNRETKDLVDYATVYRHHDPMANAALMKGNGIPDALSDFVSSRTFGRDSFTSDFLPRVAIRHILGLSHRLPDGGLFVFSLHREPRLKDFKQREREILRLTSAYLARAVFGALLQEKVRNLQVEPLATSSTGAGKDAAAASEPRCGAMVFSGAGDIIHADANALAITRRIGANGFPADLVLRDVMRLAAARVTGESLVRTFPLEGGGFVQIRLSSVGVGEGAHVIAILQVLAPGSVEAFDAASQRAGLTPRQREIAALAIRGLGNRQIAAVLNVSPVTVGIHLSHVYRRTGAQGRNELTAMFLGGSTAGGGAAQSDGGALTP